MAEYDNSKDNLGLIIDRKYYNTLDIQSFSLMLKDPSYCYKFYWLEAIVKLITQGVTETTFNNVINEMIVNAWYSVREFHIHLSGIQLGEVRDGLERAICLLTDLSGLKANASRTEILNAINEHDKELKTSKEQLTNMVPYYALSGFFKNAGMDWSISSKKRVVAYIQTLNEKVLLPYTLGESSKLKKEIYLNPEWIEMIKENAVSILGWIQFEKMKWLQMHNPEVPGLVYKLAPIDEKVRKLNNVRKLWNSVLQETVIPDVFTDKTINDSPYDIDHFVPWSFVMNDELWNLMPIDSSLNSAKSNDLPKWNPFFKRFAENQYILYDLINKDDYIHKLYEACYKDNLHSIWAGQELYIPGNEKDKFVKILEKNMKPVYDSAYRQGYKIWNYKPNAEKELKNDFK